MKFLYPLLLGGLLLAGCQQNSKPDAAGAGATTGLAGASTDTAFVITFSSLPPAELAAGATPKQLAEFAWAEFLALNWQSNYDTIRKQRDAPDPNWNYHDPSPKLTVWETYAHRTELQPANDSIRPFNSAPRYSYGEQIKRARKGVSFSLFNNLDENSEIGSCNLYGQVTSSPQQMVLYQAKVNSNEYNYILKRYPKQGSLGLAIKTNIANIKKYKAYYDTTAAKNKKYKGNCYCPPGVLCLPCGNDTLKTRQGIGTIEVKTAWRQLNANEDASKFLTRNVVYYRQKAGNDTLFYDNATFALIGMHIIHKTVNYPDFVFATFEHKDVEKDKMGFRLILQNKQKQDSLSALHYPYQRLHPLTKVDSLATVAAHRKIKAMNRNSVLLNYRLVGVQGTPTSNTSTPNFFLANYVVESDSLLANFHGSGFAHPHDQKPNILLKGKLLSAGGCQGCHGVAQQKFGTDFSFLLGGTTMAPDIDETQQQKLIRYIRATTIAAAKRKK
ncbi:hypothetical protein [Hymenobacter chitinivorans]|uniref:Cytochrome c domain-containing protein n=1 Tax=Hymenobacter chitinivorans DSM 11115 TaxID=1121954 RepID=A0A2M9B4M0_9BACT|nr:hypothetical protein [Hymenobacter chitinivorans]PJJ52894.1 hypothetical protein CLV45_3551 [Hymenobacter chitinivorans DSM 11115]